MQYLHFLTYLFKKVIGTHERLQHPKALCALLKKYSFCRIMRWSSSLCVGKQLKVKAFFSLHSSASSLFNITIVLMFTNRLGRAGNLGGVLPFNKSSLCIYWRRTTYRKPTADNSACITHLLNSLGVVSGDCSGKGKALEALPILAAKVAD